MTWIVQNLWLIPALPALAAGLSALAQTAESQVRVLACHRLHGAVVSAFRCALLTYIDQLASGGGKPRGLQLPLVSVWEASG